jgi:hypothetical protein
MLQASQLYSLDLSSICMIEVETALLYYPSTKIDNELISGLDLYLEFDDSGQLSTKIYWYLNINFLRDRIRRIFL